MKTILNTLEPIIETWEDPGDYPSGAGSGPLASYKYIAACDGEIVMEMDHGDLIDIAREADILIPDTAPAIAKVKWSVDKVEVTEGKLYVHFIVEECEGDVQDEYYGYDD